MDDCDDLAELWDILTRSGYPLVADSLRKLMTSHGRLSASVEALLAENAVLRQRLTAPASSPGNGDGQELTKEQW